MPFIKAYNQNPNAARGQAVLGHKRLTGPGRSLDRDLGRRGVLVSTQTHYLQTESAQHRPAPSLQPWAALPQ
jgi:hypothetical protein